MSFTVVNGRDDHELEDAVRRGVADGLARLLGVPGHPNSIQAMLDRKAHFEQNSHETPVRATAGSEQDA